MMATITKKYADIMTFELKDYQIYGLQHPTHQHDKSLGEDNNLTKMGDFH